MVKITLEDSPDRRYEIEVNGGQDISIVTTQQPHPELGCGGWVRKGKISGKELKTWLKSFVQTVDVAVKKHTGYEMIDIPMLPPEDAR